jgi:hypothetical protein
LKKKNKAIKNESSKIFIISIIAILAVALIGINLDRLTGKATSDIYPPFNPVTTVSINLNDKFINAGEYVHVNVNPGPKCSNRIVSFYDDEGNRRATAQPRASDFGSNRKLCNPFTVRFKTRADWKPSTEESGIFFAKAFDYGREEFISATFTIN